MNTSVPSDNVVLSGFATAEARWARLGPYYAMFPVDFAVNVVQQFSQLSSTVLDPFCGRGTAPYVALITGHRAVGCEINPVAWVYACTKMSPYPSPDRVLDRLKEVYSAVRPCDRRPYNEFQQMAFGPDVLGFINAARRELRWKIDPCDRTVAAFMLHSLHSKLGDGMSNQMRHSRSLAPQYCVRWWKQHGLTTPPDIDPVAFLRRRVQWRYAKGLPTYTRNAESRVFLGDAASILSDRQGEDSFRADLIFTSPPYRGITNYKADSWLRLWALGVGPILPDWSSQEKYASRERYESMLRSVFQAVLQHASPNAIWYVRTDARNSTLIPTGTILTTLLPHHRAYQRAAPYSRRTQTALYGDTKKKPGEVDLLFYPVPQKLQDIPQEFTPFDPSAI